MRLSLQYRRLQRIAEKIKTRFHPFDVEEFFVFASESEDDFFDLVFLDEFEFEKFRSQARIIPEAIRGRWIDSEAPPEAGDGPNDFDVMQIVLAEDKATDDELYVFDSINLTGSELLDLERQGRIETGAVRGSWWTDRENEFRSTPTEVQ